MILGANFRHDPKQPIGFDAEAVRQLRPGLVRFVLEYPNQIGDWIEAARRARLRVLWAFLPELHGVRATTLAAEFLIRAGLDVTAGIEIGGARPYRAAVTPAAHLIACLELADLFHRRIEVGDRGARGLAFGPHRPVVLQTGYVAGSKSATAFLGEILRFVRRRNARPLLQSHFHGLAASVTAPGRGWPLFLLRGLQAKAAADLGLPITVTRVGWDEGSDLVRLARLGASIGNWLDGNPWRWVRTLEPEARRRWFLEGYDEARKLGALHFIVEPEPKRDGVNAWALYRGDAGIADRIWHALQFATAREHAPARVDL